MQLWRLRFGGEGEGRFLSVPATAGKRGGRLLGNPFRGSISSASLRRQLSLCVHSGLGGPVKHVKRSADHRPGRSPDAMVGTMMGAGGLPSRLAGGCSGRQLSLFPGWRPAGRLGARARTEQERPACRWRSRSDLAAHRCEVSCVRSVAALGQLAHAGRT